MWNRLRDFWLPRFLYFSTLLLAAALAGVVLAAPFLSVDKQPGLLSLFAGDVIVRRTALASAVGLAVTAYVFFRPGGVLFFKKTDKRPPSPMAGA
jgi:ABC-type uncharacterized transport system permease subunit